jgi:hypothetical protein
MEKTRLFPKAVFVLAFLISASAVFNQSSAQCTDPIVTPISSATYNVHDAVPSIQLRSNVADAIFFWGRTNEAIGLTHLSGTGDIPAFTAANSSCTDPLTSTFTVYALDGACQSQPFVFTVTINPIPTPDAPTQVADQVYNPGDAVPVLLRSSITTAEDMGWGQTNTAIGLSTPGGQGTIIPGFTATNESCTDNISSVFTVRGLNGGHCPGPPMSFTITVNHIPTPDAPTQVADQFYNPGDAVPALLRSSITTADDMGWGQTNTAIGLSTPGGQGFLIPGFTAAANQSCTDNISSFLAW